MHILAVDQQPTKFAGGQERSLHEVLRKVNEHPETRISLCWQEGGELLDDYRQWTASDLQVKYRVFSNFKLPVMMKDFLRLYKGYITKKWDVVYCNQYFDLPIFTLLSRLTSIKLACHLRLLCPHYLSHQYRWGMVSANVLIANSEATKQSYVEAGIPEHKFRVIYNRINTSEWKPNLPPARNEKPVIAYFGRLCEEKGILDLIEAFAGMKNQAELKLYGNVRGAGTDDDFLEKCKSKAAKTSRGSDIYFYPHTDDIKEIMQSADLVVLPSWEESFGRIILEAMALEIPVVATKVGGIPEVMGDQFARQLCEAKNPESLAHKMDEWVNWRKDHPDLGMESRKYIFEKFSDFDLGNEMVRALKNV